MNRDHGLHPGASPAPTNARLSIPCIQEHQHGVKPPAGARTPVNDDRIEQLRELKAEALAPASERAADRQHDRGKLTARERVDLLIDKGSFQELDMLARHDARGLGLENHRPLGDAVVTGWGTVDGRTVFLFAEDFTAYGGSLSEVVADKICKVMDLAMDTGAPLVGLKDSGGARIQEGVAALDGYGRIFERNVRASGLIPQISVIMGPCAGGAVYSPAITDFVYQVEETAHLFITGPDVIKAVTGEEVTFDELGGAHAHAGSSGVTHFVAADDRDAMEQVRYLLSFLPSNNMEVPPYFTPLDQPDRMSERLTDLVPSSPNQPYDMVALVEEIVDDADFYQVHAEFAPNIVVGLARLDGYSVGIIGNQPASLAGTLDIKASEKAARFIRFCDAFNIPLITFVDVPGFLPGVDQEHSGIIRHGAKLLYAYAEATVPKVSVITRKAYGGAYVVMNSRSLRADMVYAWPTAEIAVMGAQGAVNVIHRREIADSDDPEAKRAELIADYEERFNNPYMAAERGLVDDVIEPRETRPRLIRTLEMLRTKREGMAPKKHGNIPL
ncbi:MAG: acyl-CoA carboxylase subunit beta [Acidimicrobiia bacterium]|nr:acyl-CoA carboxylase subunit beta [Acidimicrobiia bacterium]